MHPHTHKTPLAGIASRHDVLRLEAAVAEPLGGIASTYELLARGAARVPAAPALSFFLEADDYARPCTWTHQEWLARITQTANLLRRLGLRRNDVVAVVLPNLPETHWIVWGGEAAGTVFAINPLAESALLRDLLNAVRPRMLVTLAPTPGHGLWQKVAAVAPQVPGLETVLTVSPMLYSQSPASVDPAPALENLPVLDLHEQLHGVPADSLEFEPPCLDDVASLFCTGGTTGLPKIAVRTHRTEVANALQIAAMFGSRPLPGPLFCGLPLFHVNAQIATGLMPWSLGGHVVLGTPAGYRTKELIPNFWRIADHYRLFSFSGVPTVYSALLQVPRRGRGPASLRFGLCGAAPMPFELLKRFQQETGITILEGYGLTEGGCVSTLNPPGGTAKPGSIGIGLPWQEIKVLVLDAKGRYLRDARINETGTIAIAGPNLFRGYLNAAPEQEPWIELPGVPGAPPRRWLNTGDLGRMDRQGYFWLTGRSKELIIRGGHNIDPKVIEEPLHAHPAVALAAAVGRPDAHAGEVPVVYVQLHADASASSEQLMAWAQQYIAERAARPKKIHIIPAMPVTAVGKLFKPALIDREVAAVVDEEARAAGASLRTCEVVRDPARGIVVRWSADGEVEALRERLGLYTFHQEAA
ncbi:acyl-CoA synthetase [Variovorax sp. HW608]|uniref:acyl-CoA synthetase n=1 Tax=Variovorax sp. HW608 TaxID=1034889 RepID=UPI0012FE226D|nr:acyl-CoA synthetase [Variovorax sp. HW608]